MPEFDYVVTANKPLKVTADAVFNMHDLYKHIRSWLDNHKYVLFEKDYRDWMKESGRSAKIKLEPWKKVDDYVKFNIQLIIHFKNLKEVETKSGILNKGEVSVTFISFLEKDYESKWESNFMARFTRSLYDHFIITNKMDKYRKDILDDTYELFNEVKSFLGLHRIRKP